MEQLQIGIIGVGRFGRLHLKVFQQLPNCKVIAVADTDKVLLQEIKEEFNIERLYDNALDLIKDRSIDVIDVVSSEDTHGPFAIEAINNEKHVFIEKPIATRYKEALEIETLANLKKVQVMVGNISRFSTPYASIKKAIESNKLGEIGSIRTKRNFSKDWFDHFGKRVHPVYESGIHDLDLILWYVNSPCVEVYATERNLSGYAYPDLFSVILTFKNGMVASLDSAWLYPKGGPQNLVETLELDGTIDAEIEVCGMKGTANFQLSHSGYSIWTDEGVMHPELTLWTTEQGHIGGAIRAELSHFIYQVRMNEISEISPLGDSVEALKIADAIVQSATEKRIIIFSA